MGDLKLYRVGKGQAKELAGKSATLEKRLQTTFEQNLDELLGVRFLETEYSTGKVHGGRIDTLGVDEDGCPVIIEYKRDSKENVINQGLFYLDWLVDHKAEFEGLLAAKKVEVEVDWTSPRLICIAGDFTRYDDHAIKQIGREITLIRYKLYENDLLLLDLAGSAKDFGQPEKTRRRTDKTSSGQKTFTDLLDQSDQGLKEFYETVRTYLLALGDDAQEKVCKYYSAFKRIKNFACLEVHPQTKEILVYLKLTPREITLEKGFSRDVSKIGHFGTGNLELRMKTVEDFEKAKVLMQQAFEKN